MCYDLPLEHYRARLSWARATCAEVLEATENTVDASLALIRSSRELLRATKFDIELSRLTLTHPARRP